jgi:hypothetical protein
VKYYKFTTSLIFSFLSHSTWKKKEKKKAISFFSFEGFVSHPLSLSFSFSMSLFESVIAVVF